jgi:hypothetical protein
MKKMSQFSNLLMNFSLLPNDETGQNNRETINLKGKTLKCHNNANLKGKTQI